MDTRSRYTFSIPARLVFDVDATTADDARATARRVVNDVADRSPAFGVPDAPFLTLEFGPIEVNPDDIVDCQDVPS